MKYLHSLDVFTLTLPIITQRACEFCDIQFMRKSTCIWIGGICWCSCNFEPLQQALIFFRSVHVIAASACSLYLDQSNAQKTYNFDKIFFEGLIGFIPPLKIIFLKSECLSSYWLFIFSYIKVKGKQQITQIFLWAANLI